MSSSVQSEIIEEINRRVDPQRLLERMNHHPESIRALGGMIKCFCPIHKEEKFSTLLIDTTKRTFKCALRTCEANKGGNLVELFALFQGQSSPLQAAFSLMKFAEVPADASLLARLCADFLAEGKTALEQGRMEEAAELIVQAMEVDPASVDAHLLASHLAHLRGSFSEAIDHAQRAASLAEGAGNLARAIEIIQGTVLELFPDDEDSLLHLAGLHEAAGHPKESLSIFLQVIEARRARGDRATIIPLLERVLERDPERIDSRLALAESLEAAGERPGAAQQYFLVAELYDRQGNHADALGILEHVRALDTANIAARELTADIHKRLGNLQAFSRELIDLASMLLRAGEENRAEGFYRQILEADPESVSAREGLVHVLQMRGDLEGVAQEEIFLADLYSRLGFEDQALDALRTARIARPEDPDLRRRFIEQLMQAGETLEACEEMLDLSRLLFARGGDTDAIGLLEKISSMAPSSMDIRQKVAAAYGDAGLNDRAMDELLSLARAMIGGQDWNAALQACDAALALDEQSIEARQLKVATLRSAQALDEAVRESLALVALLLQAGERPEAEKALEAALEIDPENAGLQRQLIDLHLQDGRVADALVILRNLAKILIRKSQTEEILGVCRQILELDPEDLDTRQVYASTCMEAGQAEEAVAQHKRIGHAWLEKDDPEAARVHFEKALEIDPDSIEVLRAICDILAQTQSFEEAWPYSQRILALLEKNDKPDDIKAEFEALVKRYDREPDVRRAYAEWLLAHQQLESSFEQYLKLAALLEEEKENPSAAAEILERLTELDPSRVAFRAAYARLLRRLERIQSAVEQMQAAAELHFQAGEEPEAVKWFEDILEIAPEMDEVRERLADLLARRGSTERAIRHFLEIAARRRARDRERENIELYRRVLALDPEQSEVRRRLAENLEGESFVNEAIDQWLLLAETSEKAGNPSQAVEIARHLVELDAEDTRPRLILVRLHQSLGDAESQKQELDGLVALYHSLGEFAEAERCLRQMIELAPEDLVLPERLGRLLEEQQRADEACDLYFSTAARHHALGEQAMARALLVRVRTAQPDRIEARKLLAQVCESLGDARAAARECLDIADQSLKSGEESEGFSATAEAARLAGANWDLHIELAQLLSHHGFSERAIKQLLSAMNFAAKLPDIQGGLQLSEEALNQNPKSREVRERRIELFRLAKRNEDAASEFRILARQAVEEEDVETGILYYQELLELAPSDIEARQEAASLYLKLGETADAANELRRIFDLHQEGGRIEEAIQTAGSVLALEAGDEATRAARAKLCIRLGNIPQAVEDYETLAELAFDRSDWAAAERSLRSVLEIAPDNLASTRRLAEVVQKAHSLEVARPIQRRRLELAVAQLPAAAAAAEFAEAIESDPENPELHLNHARFLRGNKNKEKNIAGAATAYRKAVSLYESSGELEECCAILAEMGEILPEDNDLLAHRGRLLRQLNRLEESAEILVQAGEGFIEGGEISKGAGALLQALEINPDNEPLLGRVAGLYEDSGAADQASDLYLRLADLQEKRSAREESLATLLRILQIKPDHQDVRERVAYYYEDVGDAEKASEQWLVLAQKHEKSGALREAVTICLHVKEIDAAAREPRERLIRLYIALEEMESAKQEIAEMADLCEALGDNEAVEKLIQQALAIDALDPAFLRRLAHFYKGSNRAEEAVQALDRLARAFQGTRQLREAIEVLREVCAMRPGDCGPHETIVELLAELNDEEEASREALAVAGLLLDSEEYDRALSWLGRAVDLAGGKTGKIIEAAETLYQRGRRTEAANWLLDQARAKIVADEPQNALILVENAIEWSPGAIEALEARLECELLIGDYDAALDTCKTLARAHEEKGDTAKLEAIWKRALEIDTSDVESHEGLISVLEKQGSERVEEAIAAILRLSEIHRKAERPKKAVECHRRALSLVPDRHAIRDELAQMLLSIGDWPSALEEYLALAQAHLDKEDLPKSRAYFEKVLELDSENVDALRTLIQIVRRLGDHEAHIAFSTRLAGIYTQVSDLADAAQCYREMVEFSPDHIEGWETLGSLLEQSGQAREAADVWSNLASLYEAHGDLYAAIEKMQKIEAVNPSDIANLQRLAYLSARTKDSQTGQRLARLVEVCETAGNLDAAFEACGKWTEFDSDDPAPRRARARILAATGKNEEAVEDLSAAATLHQGREEPAEAAATLADLLDLAPQRIDERERYCLLLKSAGENDRAIDQFLILADTYEAQDDIARAISRCRDILNLNSASLDAHTRLLRLYVSRNEIPLALAEVNWLLEHYSRAGEIQQVREILEAGLQLDPHNIVLLERLAQLHVDTGRLDEATNQYLRIAEAALVRGDIQRATHAMECARDCSPDDGEIRRNLAEIYVRQGNHKSARLEFYEIARLYLAQGLVADARGTLDALIIQTPKDEQLREKIATLYLDHGIPELAALQFVELARLKFQEQDPNGVVAYARRALEIKPRTIEAKELLVEAQVAQGDVAGAYETYSDLAELFSQTGQTERAIVCLHRMIEFQPSEPDPRQRLVEALQGHNQTGSAIEEMRKLGALYSDRGELDKAVGIQRRILEVRPDDTRARVAYIETYLQFGPEQDLVDDYIKLAHVHIRHGDPDQAIQCFEKALAISPQDTAHREDFIKFLLGAGETKRAERESEALCDIYSAQGNNREIVTLLQKVLAAAKDNTGLRLRLAEAHNRLNARGMALRELRIVVQAYQRQDNIQGLIRTLRLILDIDPQNVDIRGQLIEILDRQGAREEQVAERMQLADVYMSRGLLDLARDEYRSITRLDPKNQNAWNYLVAAREQLGEQEGLADDYAALGALCEDAGNTALALEHYQKAFNLAPDHIEARRRYIAAYRKTGPETDLVDHYLLMADAMVRANRIDEAIGIYSHVMSIDPANERARQKLADTQARAAGMLASRTPAHPGTPIPALPGTPVPEPPRAAAPATPSPAEGEAALSAALDSVFAEATEPPTPVTAEPELPALQEEEAGLEQVIANYRDILQVNPQNATVRLKLADIYEQMGRRDDVIHELIKASEIFFQKSELNMCVSVCERILGMEPANVKVRERLSKAVLKRDAFKALESAILFSDQLSQGEEDEGSSAKGRTPKTR